MRCSDDNWDKTRVRKIPPGFGCKLTIDGQYDVENNRLCNVAESREPNHAANLSLVKRLIEQQLAVLLRITTKQREDLADLHLKIEILQDQVERILKNIEKNVETNLDLAIPNSKSIALLEAAWSNITNYWESYTNALVAIVHAPTLGKIKVSNTCSLFPMCCPSLPGLFP